LIVLELTGAPLTTQQSTIPDNEDKLSGAAVPSFSFVPKLPILGVGEEGTTKSIGVVIRTYKNQELTLPALVFSLAQAGEGGGTVQGEERRTEGWTEGCLVP